MHRPMRAGRRPGRRRRCSGSPRRAPLSRSSATASRWRTASPGSRSGPLASGLRLRPLLAAAPAVGTIMAAWALLERPVSWGAFGALAVLALVPMLAGAGGRRTALAVVALLVGLAVAFETWPHRGLETGWKALHDAPSVRAPFDPLAFPALHGLVASTAFGLALAAAFGVAARRPAIVVAAVAIGVGFPATLLEDAYAFRLGAL